MKRTMSGILFAFTLFTAALLAAQAGDGAGSTDPVRAAQFRNPPPTARPWVFWFWINGNISREGITADLEALKRVGVGGVVWMEVSGPWWAPDGDVTPLSPRWHEAFQWAVRECRRLGLQFDVSVDFGYGSGGPHITPELSMQQLVSSEMEVEGGRRIDVLLEKPPVRKNVSAWLRPDAKISRTVLDALERTDSYKDVATLALPLPPAKADRAYRIPAINMKNGLLAKEPRRKSPAAQPAPGAVTPRERVIDLTGRMDPDGRLQWDAPAGQWLIVRFGHASNYKMTRPCPAAAVGLECDRLARTGIETHYNAFLKKLFEGAGAAAGGTLSYVHIDSWEAGSQNWTATFPDEFRRRRGYDLHPWLPVMTGRVIESSELSERFLWDVRATISEMIRDNYAGRLKELARAHGIKFSTEAYGNLCIDDLAYAGVSDLPMGEYWAGGTGLFPSPAKFESVKAMASAAHAYGQPVIGAEAFTSGRGWGDHPFLLKAMGDEAFCWGLNRQIFHLSAHQAYSQMIPGLTHRKWGEHFQRNNTWWEYSRPWLDYLARCQFLLQQGTPVADVCCWVGEGAPLSVYDMKMTLPAGYDYDFCSTENVLRMTVRDGRIVLPSGTSYRYLQLPGGDRMTAPLARKIRELVAGGARVIGGKKPIGSPGLTDYPQCDRQVAQVGAELWDSGRVISGRKVAEVFKADGLAPDFEGGALHYAHRQLDDAEAYFISNQENRAFDQVCAFRVAGKRPELWDPESGAIRDLPDFAERDGRITVPLHFDPMQSWFVVFRQGAAPAAPRGSNFTPPKALRQITGPWAVSFDPKWGGPGNAVGFGELADWSKHPDPRIHYYSGTAVYRKSLTLAEAEANARDGRLLLDLGAVEVMARVRLNGQECGIAWKPPYLVDLSAAARPGANALEIDVVNLWINRMIGDEQLPEDCAWKDFETLAEWPAWFKRRKARPSGPYTFTSARHYSKDSPLVPSGLLGPVVLKVAPAR